MKRREFLKAGLAAGAALGADWRAFAAAEGVPAYYAEHLARVSARVEALSKVCDDGFWFITDVHTAHNQLKSGPILAKLVASGPLKKVLNGGDLVVAFGGGGEKDKAAVDEAAKIWRERYVRPIEAAGGTVFSAKGNHDFTIRSSMKERTGFTYSGAEAKRILTEGNGRRGAVTNPSDPEACYCYFDNAETRIRTIVADTSDSIDPKRPYWAVVNGMGETQLRWMEEVAFGTLPEGWSVVAMHHIPVAEVAGYESDARTFAKFRALLERHAGKVLLDVTGHHHTERQTWQNGIWHVTCPCDTGYNDGRAAPWDMPVPKKAAGTVYEQTFEAVQFDRSREYIHFTRVGYGADRTLHCKPLSVKAGGKLKLEAKFLKGKVKWACYDADGVDFVQDPANRWGKLAKYRNFIAEMGEDGVLSAKKAGVSIAVAVSETGEKELVPVMGY